MAEPTALGREGSRFGIFEVRRGIVRSSVLLGLENCEVVGDCDDHDEDAVKDDGDDYVHHHDEDVLLMMMMITMLMFVMIMLLLMMMTVTMTMMMMMMMMMAMAMVMLLFATECQRLHWLWPSWNYRDYDVLLDNVVKTAVLSALASCC